MSYVVLPSEAILARLTTCGCLEAKDVHGREIVYVRSHDLDSRYVVKIYTSVCRGMSVARGRGADAIRVVAVFQGRGIFKGKRIHRTGTVEGVLDRMVDRMREAYAACNEHRGSL